MGGLRKRITAGAYAVGVVATACTMALGTTTAAVADQPAAPVASASDVDVAAGPTLESYDRASFTLRGSGFLPSHRVWVRTAVAGAVPSCGGLLISDIRTSGQLLQTTSDPAGAISVRVDPKSTLPPLLTCDNPIQYFYGAYPGEQLSFSAHDERYVGGQLQWSNTLTITA